jgi:hypothetical protein
VCSPRPCDHLVPPHSQWPCVDSVAFHRRFRVDASYGLISKGTCVPTQWSYPVLYAMLVLRQKATCAYKRRESDEMRRWAFAANWWWPYHCRRPVRWMWVASYAYIHTVVLLLQKLGSFTPGCINWRRRISLAAPPRTD